MGKLSPINRICFSNFLKLTSESLYIMRNLYEDRDFVLKFSLGVRYSWVTANL